MLFKKRFLTLIEKGEIQTAYRKWSHPSVSESGTLLTAVGQLRITFLKKIEYDQITDSDVRKAGYVNRNELDKELSFKKVGDLYKIGFKLEKADPRIKLRENTDISESEMLEILTKLERLDSRGKVKYWTFKILKLVNVEPGKHAIEYATKLGYEKEWFKLHIRKIKNMGLTISLKDGYEISPRGKIVLERLKD